MFGLRPAPQPYRLGPLLIVALVLWVPLAMLVGFVFMRAEASVLATEEQRLRDTARSLATAVDAKLGTYIASLTTLAGSHSLDGASDLAGFEQQARMAGTVLGGTIMLRGPLPDAAVLVNTAAQPALVSGLVAAGAFPNAMQGTMADVYNANRTGLSDLFRSPVRAKPLMLVAVPVLRDGQPARRLSLSIEPGALEGLLRQVGLPPGTSGTIRDGLFQPVAAVGAVPGSRDITALDWLRRGMEGRDAALLEGSDAGGQRVAVAAERLQTDPRWMVTVTEELAGKDAARHRALALPGLGAGLAVLGIVAVVWAARRERLRRALEEAEALRAMQAEVERLHARLPAVIFLREVPPEGGQGRLLYRAGDIEGVLGWPEAEIGDRPLRELSETPEIFDEGYRRAMHGEELSAEWRIRQPDGGWRWVRGSGRKLQGLPNGGMLLVGYVVDITAERAAQAQAQAARRLASLADMAHGLAHELKQPLQVISLSAEAAKVQLSQAAAMAGLPAPARLAVERSHEALEGIAYQAVRTGSVIEHLRRFARGSAEGTPTEPVRLDAAVDGAMLLVQHGLSRAGVAVDVTLGEPVPVVMGQVIAIEQILVNLLNNARDAFEEQPPGRARRIRIAARLEADGQHVALSIADTAGGIPARVLDRLFEPFASTKGFDKGTGLGLAICRGLAVGMGATITGFNEGDGAVFVLRMPLAPLGALRAEVSGEVPA